MSNSQPFCDKSHIGSSFKPLKFSLDEKASSMHLCGCKLSSKAPFCDGVTCEKLMRGERINTAPAHLEELEEGLSDESDDADTTSEDEGPATPTNKQ